ncbi:MAG: 16S rRNA (guanine(527)-N(7))-methyltransferase RsmG [Clostridiales bacterium]|nr:16S rRNA (guanine(527)-N(7))-methyltransferase RsmG [Clostridiales bacterium]
MSSLTPDLFASLYARCADSSPALSSLALPDDAVYRLWTVCDHLIDNAKRFNLTAILEPEEIVRKHVADSLIPLALLRENGIDPAACRAILDVGTGAGFPLLPWACALPESVALTGLDATAKKISHIRASTEAAGLSNVAAVQGRAEEAAREGMREHFDLVTARAVAALPVLCELCAPLVKVGGAFAALKSHAEDEIRDAAPAAAILGFDEASPIAYELPGGDARTLVVYRKTRPTPAKYPRRYAEITKQPLA